MDRNTDICLLEPEMRLASSHCFVDPADTQWSLFITGCVLECAHPATTPPGHSIWEKLCSETRRDQPEM